MHQTHCTWQQLSFFFSSQNVQRYLARCYKKSSIQDAEKKFRKLLSLYLLLRTREKLLRII